MKRTYELLIFDWDGTLMDSAGQIVSSATRAIELMGLPARQPAQIRELIGLGLRDAFDRLYPEISSSEMDSLLAEYGRRFSGVPPQTSLLFDGVREALVTLRDEGYQLAIATGKSRRGLDRALDETSLGELFTITRCADETANKPDPKMLHDILLRTATDAERALMVGDTEYDMEMAARANVPALAVSCGVHEIGRLREAGAMTVLAAVSEMPAWLAKQV